MNRWGLSQVSDKFAAEFGDWPDSGSLPVERCEAIAFVVANDRADAEAIVQSMNDLALEPSEPARRGRTCWRRPRLARPARRTRRHRLGRAGRRAALALLGWAHGS